MIRRREARWHVVAAVLGIAGLALRMTPPAVPDARVPPPTLPEPRPPADPGGTAAALLTYEAIAQASVFSPDRRPSAAPRRGAPAHARAGDGAEPRLYGVASGPSGAVALIDADPAIPGAEIYRVGDPVAGYTLVVIADTLVVLDGRPGRRTLRLQTAPRRSP